MSFHPADGLLFQEQGRPEIYLIREGERLRIPNPYVMEALSLDWNAVQTVPAGTLDVIPRDPSWEALGTRTPWLDGLRPDQSRRVWVGGPGVLAGPARDDKAARCVGP